MATVRIRLGVPAGAADAWGTVRVSVQDVTFPDMPATVVGERIVPPGPLGELDEIPVEVDDPDADGRYVVRVHVDMSGSGAVERGDLVAAAPVPVLTQGHGDRAQVALRRV
jgi:putative lipoprotein